MKKGCKSLAVRAMKKGCKSLAVRAMKLYLIFLIIFLYFCRSLIWGFFWFWSLDVWPVWYLQLWFWVVWIILDLGVLIFWIFGGGGTGREPAIHRRRSSMICSDSGEEIQMWEDLRWAMPMLSTIWISFHVKSIWLKTLAPFDFLGGDFGGLSLDFGFWTLHQRQNIEKIHCLQGANPVLPQGEGPPRGNSREFFFRAFLEFVPGFWETKRLWIKFCTIFGWFPFYHCDTMLAVLMNLQFFWERGGRSGKCGVLKFGVLKFGVLKCGFLKCGFLKCEVLIFWVLKFGSWNAGSWNVGSWNVGSWNVGSWNVGSWNLPLWNLGSWNVGSWNLGSWNVGSWNLGSMFFFEIWGVKIWGIEIWGLEMWGLEICRCEMWGLEIWCLEMWGLEMLGLEI